jgi:hypothetical protein
MPVVLGVAAGAGKYLHFGFVAALGMPFVDAKWKSLCTALL